MSKLTDERTTPDTLFNQLHSRFAFEVDLFASDSNAKLPIYYTKQNSAFGRKWTGSNFANPPYSMIWECLNYGNKQNALVVWILPCDSSTQWWHDFVWDEKTEKFRKGIKVLFPKGRFRFGKYTTSPKFATIIVIMDNR